MLESIVSVEHVLLESTGIWNTFSETLGADLYKVRP